MPLFRGRKKSVQLLTARASAVTISSRVGLFLVAVARTAKEDEEEEELDEGAALESENGDGGDALVVVKGRCRRRVVVVCALLSVLLHPARCCWQGEEDEDDDDDDFGIDVEATPAERIVDRFQGRRKEIKGKSENASYFFAREVKKAKLECNLRALSVPGFGPGC